MFFLHMPISSRQRQDFTAKEAREYILNESEQDFIGQFIWRDPSSFSLLVYLFYYPLGQF